jgi:hypothetical protein
MTREQIKDYRGQIDSQIKEKENDIESNMSLIIIGSLGFFLTINERFIGLNESSCKYLMFLSVSLLLSSLLFLLISKYYTVEYDKNILNFIDDNLVPNDDILDKCLLDMWTRFETNLKRFKRYTYWCLGLGILFQVIFFLYNVLNPKMASGKEVEKIRIEIITKDSTLNGVRNNIQIDSILPKMKGK